VRPHESEAEMAVSETTRGKADTRQRRYGQEWREWVMLSISKNW
jgi:hypothetical protein